VAHDHTLHYDLQKFAESVKNRTTVYHGLAEVMIDRTPFGQFQPTVLRSFWDASLAEYAPLLQIIMFFLVDFSVRNRGDTVLSRARHFRSAGTVTCSGGRSRPKYELPKGTVLLQPYLTVSKFYRSRNAMV